jgi:hypothetical protein
MAEFERGLVAVMAESGPREGHVPIFAMAAYSFVSMTRARSASFYKAMRNQRPFPATINEVSSACNTWVLMSDFLIQASKPISFWQIDRLGPDGADGAWTDAETVQLLESVRCPHEQHHNGVSFQPAHRPMILPRQAGWVPRRLPLPEPPEGLQ